jgi:hypothetical protein
MPLDNTPITPSVDPNATPAEPAEQQPSVISRALSDIGDFASNAPSEIGKAVVGGTARFINEGTKSIDHLARAGTNAIRDAGIPDYDLSVDQDGIHLRQAQAGEPDPTPDLSTSIHEAQNDTATGKLLSSGVQWTEGMATLGKVLGPLKYTAGLARAGEVGVRSAANLATFFDPYAARLSNLIQDSKSLQNPVAQFLQADPNDPEVVARLKNGLEGTLEGAALDSFIHGVTSISHYMRGDPEQAVASAQRVTESSAVAPESPTPDVPQDSPAATAEALETDQPVSVPHGQNVFVGNDMVERDPNAKYEFTPEEISQTAARLLGAHAADRVDPFNTLSPDLSPINLKYVVNPQAQQSLLTEIGNQIGQQRQARGIVDSPMAHADTLASAQDLAQSIGQNPSEAFDTASRIVGNVQKANEYVPALKVYLQSVASALRQHADWHADGVTGPYSSPDELMDAAMGLSQQFQEFGAKASDLGTAAGRLLNAHQIITDGDSTLSQAVTKANMGGVPDARAATRLMLARIAAAPNNLESVAQIAKPLADGSWGQKLSSYWINALLGYTTLVKKGVSDIFKGGFVQPTEQAFKGLYRGAGTGDWTQFTQAGGQVTGMLKSIFDTLEFGGRSSYGFTKDAFVTGRQSLDQGGHNGGFVPETTTGGDIGQSNVLTALKGGDYTEAMTSGLGATLQFPSRLINTLHEFSQQTIYRGRIYGKATTEATLQGLDGDLKDRFVQQAMADSFGPNGEALDQEALEYARAGTYSTQPAAGTLTGSLNDWLQKHPLGRLIVPFSKAPANLLYDVYQYTPIAKPVVDGIKSILGRGGPPAEEQAARLATGAAIWSLPLYLAYNGMLTDGGSLDPNARSEQMETGWRPHSLVLTDGDGTKKYYPVDAIDPFGQVLSMAADMHAISGQIGNNELGRLATHAVIAISHDSLSKTYLRTASALLSALGDTSTAADAESKWNMVAKAMAGGIVPTQLARANDDPIMRDTRNLIDAMKARLPGWGSTLDRRYNTLGELVEKTPALGPEFASPFYKSQDTNDQTQQVLSQIANSNPTGFRPAPATAKVPNSNGPGVDLRQIKMPNGHSAYDRYQSLIGDFEDGSPTFRDQLTDAINRNPDFWKNPAPDGTADSSGQRYMALNAFLHDRREAAQAMLRQENPEVDRLMKEDVLRGMDVLQHGGANPAPSLPGLKQRP